MTTPDGYEVDDDPVEVVDAAYEPPVAPVTINGVRCTQAEVGTILQGLDLVIRTHPGGKSTFELTQVRSLLRLLHGRTR